MKYSPIIVLIHYADISISFVQQIIWKVQCLLQVNTHTRKGHTSDTLGRLECSTMPHSLFATIMMNALSQHNADSLREIALLSYDPKTLT